MYGDAAEQVVRMSLEGVEVIAKISGEAAKDVAVLLAAVLKEEHKTKGKARLSNMIRSGKELKVFSVQNKDLKKFASEANRYGVLYCVLKDKNNMNPTATVDVIARAEDASKIQRIMDRFELATVDVASVVSEVQRDIESRTNPEKQGADINPDVAKTEKSPLSERDSKYMHRTEEGTSKQKDKPSVRKKLNEYKKAAAKRMKEKEAERGGSHERREKTSSDRSR